MVPKNPSRARKGGRVRTVRSSKPPPPDISIAESPVGRATLSAILREMQTSSPDARQPFVTIGYDEKPLDEGEQRADAEDQPTCTDDPDTPPEVTVSETRAGFETMAVIDDELLRDAERLTRAQQQKRLADAEVLELFTFVILDRSLSTAATNDERRAFVEQRLWHRLPPGGVDAIRRIDVRPADDTALMMRVWCAVPKIAR